VSTTFLYETDHRNRYGSIDAPSVIHQLLASTQSGDMHTAVYDFAANTM
jgi:hypothetical protein